MLRVQSLWSHILRGPQYGNPPSRLPYESYNRDRCSPSRASFDLCVTVTDKWVSHHFPNFYPCWEKYVYWERSFTCHLFPNRQIVQININSHFSLKVCCNGTLPPSSPFRAHMERVVLIGFFYAPLKTLVKSCPDNYLSFKVSGKEPLSWFSGGAPFEIVSCFQSLLFIPLYPEEKEPCFRHIDPTPWPNSTLELSINQKCPWTSAGAFGP